MDPLHVELKIRTDPHGGHEAEAPQAPMAE